MSSDVEAVAVEGHGTLYSFTEVQSAPAGFEAPYVIGLVDLDCGGRVMGTVLGAEPRVGMPVVVSGDWKIVAREA
jgi:uncharacterized OB-fold protein